MKSVLRTEGNNVTPKSSKYTSAETAAIRKATVQDVLMAQTDLLTKSQTKTNLRNVEDVKRVTLNFVQRCADIGIVPNIEGLSAALGVSRQRLYDFIRDGEGNESAEFLNRVRLMWASARMSLCERGCLDNAMSIFILKNSGLNFSDKHEVELDMVPKDQRPDWAYGMSDAAYKEKLIEGIIDIDDGEIADE